MNVFTTDHPMTSMPSCFDAKAHPWLSFVCRIFVITLILTLLVYGFLVYSVVTDDASSTDDPDGPIFLFGIAISFVFSLVCAFLMVSAYRLVVWHIRRRGFWKSEISAL